MDNQSEQFNGSNFVIGSNPLFTKSELDWFDFETRIRRIIYDLLLPVNTRMKEVKDTNEHSRLIVNNMEKSVNDFRLTNKHYDMRIRQIEEIAKRLYKLEEEQTAVDQKIHGVTKNVANLHQQIIAFQGAINTQFHTLEKNFNRQGMYDYIQEQVDGIKNEYIKEVIEAKQERDRYFDTYKEQVDNLTESIRLLQARSLKMSEELVSNNVKVKTYEMRSTKIRDKLKEVHEKVKTNKNKLEGINGLDNHKKDVSVRMAFIENYIMNTIPIQTQQLITNAMQQSQNTKSRQSKFASIFSSQIQQLIAEQKKPQNDENKSQTGSPLKKSSQISLPQVNIENLSHGNVGGGQGPLSSNEFHQNSAKSLQTNQQQNQQNQQNHVQLSPRTLRKMQENKNSENNQSLSNLYANMQGSNNNQNPSVMNFMNIMKGSSLFQTMVQHQNQVENNFRNHQTQQSIQLANQMQLLQQQVTYQLMQNQSRNNSNDSQQLNNNAKDQRVSFSPLSSSKNITKNLFSPISSTKNDQQNPSNQDDFQSKALSDKGDSNSKSKRLSVGKRVHGLSRTKKKSVSIVDKKNQPRKSITRVDDIPSKRFLYQDRESKGHQSSDSAVSGTGYARQRTQSLKQMDSIVNRMAAKIDETRRQSEFPQQSSHQADSSSTPMRQLFMNLKFNTPIQEVDNSLYGSESGSGSGVNIVAGLGTIANMAASQNANKNQLNPNIYEQSEKEKTSSRQSDEQRPFSESSKSRSSKQSKKSAQKPKKKRTKKIKLNQDEIKETERESEDEKEDSDDDLDFDDDNSVSVENVDEDEKAQQHNLGQTEQIMEDDDEELDSDSLRTDTLTETSLDERLKSEFRQVNIKVQDLEEKVAYLEGKLKSNEKDFSRKVDLSKSHIELVVEGLKDELEKLTHRWQRFKTDNDLFNKEQQNNISKARDECRIVRENNETVLDLFQLMQESIRILIALQIQDEIDRKSLSLVGQKSHFVKASRENALQSSQNIRTQPSSPRGAVGGVIERVVFNQYIQLDPQCLSCSQNPNEIKTAFKLACLSYKPSNIEFKNIIFERQNLLQLLTFVVDETEVLENQLARQSHEHKIIMNKLLNRVTVWQNEKIQRSFGVEKLGDNLNHSGHQRNMNQASTSMLSSTNQLLSEKQYPLMNENQQVFVRNRRKKQFRNMSSHGFDTYDMMINRMPNLSPLSHIALAPFLEETQQLKQIRRQREILNQTAKI
ncbi:UNKNOWN [Stylonychia lemnae]|uniref:Uncharacterized protein n=1 Tax=Stylonychia lemnae TaxID=5949 RepID=A0A078B1X0_STYLE|nr:UNKNOWN [Stylonychia lemnae]|eukprot:CDW87328.1 UNKNOWN [Stylonychia lemnae]